MFCSGIHPQPFRRSKTQIMQKFVNLFETSQNLFETSQRKYLICPFWQRRRADPTRYLDMRRVPRERLRIIFHRPDLKTARCRFGNTDFQSKYRFADLEICSFLQFRWELVHQMQYDGKQIIDSHSESGFRAQPVQKWPSPFKDWILDEQFCKARDDKSCSFCRKW